MDSFCYDFLIGLDLIKAFQLCQTKNLEIIQKIRGRYYKVDSFQINDTLSINFIELQADLNHLDLEKSQTLKHLIHNFNHAFTKNKFDVEKVVDHEVSLKLTEHKYISRKLYRFNIVDQKEIENQISKLLEAGLIEESTPPFAAPVILVYKKQTDSTRLKNRLYIDYTMLNKVIISENQPFPLIEDLIVKARDSKWFSLLDISSVFWSVP